jgi:hypothetical protein
MIKMQKVIQILIIIAILMIIRTKMKITITINISKIRGIISKCNQMMLKEILKLLLVLQKPYKIKQIIQLTNKKLINN